MDKKLLEAVQKAAEFANVEASQVADLIETETKSVWDGITSTHTGAWAELVRDSIYADKLTDLVVKETPILGALPWSHGSVNASSIKVPIKGHTQLFKTSAESKGTQGTGITGWNDVSTGEVEINIQKFEYTVFMSSEAVHRYVANGTLVNEVRKEILNSQSETITNYILNKSTTGLVALAKTNEVGNDTTPSALDAAFLKNMQLALGEYAAEDDKLLWIGSSKFGTSVKYIDRYETIDKYGKDATVLNAGMPARIEDIPFYKTRHLGDSTGGKSQAILAYTPAIQYAFGQPLEIVPIKRAWGIYFDCAFRFGVGIASEQAGLGKTSALGVVA